MSRTLVLNKSYIPIRITSKYSAIGKLYCGVAEAIRIEKGILTAYNWDEWTRISAFIENWPADSEFVASSTCCAVVPRVIRCLHYDKVPRVHLRLNKRSIFARDKNTCYICGKEFSPSNLSVDHFVPISKGGKNDWCNLVTCCKRCNEKKGSSLWSELSYKPKFMPRKPLGESNIARLKLTATEAYPEWEYFGI